MTSVDAVDPAEATEPESPRRRRGRWIPITPDVTQSAVVIPSGRSAVMWIVNPQGDLHLGNDTWQGYVGAPLRIRSLGVERDVNMPYQGTLWVSGREDIDRMGKAMQEACEA